MRSWYITVLIYVEKHNLIHCSFQRFPTYAFSRTAACWIGYWFTRTLQSFLCNSQYVIWQCKSAFLSVRLACVKFENYEAVSCCLFRMNFETFSFSDDASDQRLLQWAWNHNQQQEKHRKWNVWLFYSSHWAQGPHRQAFSRKQWVGVRDFWGCMVISRLVCCCEL